MSIIGTIYEDVTTDVLGKIGPWQWLVTIASTTLMISNLFDQYQDMFLLKHSEVSRTIVCLPPEEYAVLNLSLCSFNNGTDDIECTTWHVKLLGLIWLKKTWIVYCEELEKQVSMSIISRIGLVFGCVIFGLIADSVGRKCSMIIGITLELPLRLVMTFCDSESWLQLLIFLRAVFGSANVFMGLLLACEIASNTWRSCLMTMVCLPRVLSSVYTVPMANSLQDNETVSFVAFLVTAGLVCVLRWTPESPHWLMYNRKIHVAEKILMDAAKFNGVKLTEDFKIRPVDHRAYTSLEATYTCVGILTTYNIRITTLVTLLFWSIFDCHWSLLYLSLFHHELRYILLTIPICNFIFGCLTVFLSQRMKLRQLLLVNILVSGLLASAMLFLVSDTDSVNGRTAHETAKTILSTLMISCGVISRCIILIITPRLFAVNIRATMVGCCHAVGALGSIVSCLVLQQNYRSSSMGLVVSCTLCLMVLGWLLPDVDGRELPDVMEDMDYFSELAKPLRWATQKTNSPSKEEVLMRIYSYGGSSSSRTSEVRPPARPIGFRRAWSNLTRCLHQLHLRLGT